MKSVENMADREIQEALLENSRRQIYHLASINNKLTFFMIITIIGLVLIGIGAVGL